MNLTTISLLILVFSYNIVFGNNIRDTIIYLATNNGIFKQNNNSISLQRLENIYDNEEVHDLLIINNHLIIFSIKNSFGILKYHSDKSYNIYPIITNNSHEELYPFSFSYFKSHDSIYFIYNDQIMVITDITCKREHTFIKKMGFLPRFENGNITIDVIKNPTSMTIDKNQEIMFVGNGDDLVYSGISCCEIVSDAMLKCKQSNSRGGKVTIMVVDEINSFLYIYNSHYKRISRLSYKKCELENFTEILPQEDIAFDITGMIVLGKFLIVTGKNNVCKLNVLEANRNFECINMIDFNINNIEVSVPGKCGYKQIITTTPTTFDFSYTTFSNSKNDNKKYNVFIIGIVVFLIVSLITFGVYYYIRKKYFNFSYDRVVLFKK